MSTVRPRAAAKKPKKPNRWFQVRRSRIQGRGAFAIREIPRGTRIIEYTGQRVTPEEADERYVDDDMERHHTFLFLVDDDTIIDAAKNGNEARFINHGCAPNCKAYVEGKRVFIYARKKILPGEELLYDYGLVREGRPTKAWKKLYACKCGAETCRGTMLAKPKKKRKPVKKAARRDARPNGRREEHARRVA